MTTVREIKQVLIIRRDIKKFNISVGKLLVQVAHGAVEGYRNVIRIDRKVAEEWILQGQKKIVLHVDDEAALLRLYRKAISLNIPCALIRDAGLTELPPGTLTVLVLGPWFSDSINKVSGSLPLLKKW